MLSMKDIPERMTKKDAAHTVEHMLKECLRKMASVLLHIVRSNMLYNVRAPDASVRYNQELSFASQAQGASKPKQINTRKNPGLSPIASKKPRVEEDTKRRL